MAQQTGDLVWNELDLAISDRQHGWRTPALATVDAQGHPRARTLVLREVDRLRWRLICYTDARSPKVAQIGAEPRAELVFWDPARAWQLRAEAQLSIVSEGDTVARLWQKISPTPSAADYLSARAPGEPLGHQSEPAQADTPALALIIAQVSALDWLRLSARGHQRLRITPQGETPLVP